MNANQPPDIYAPGFVREKLLALPRETTPKRINPAIRGLCGRLAAESVPGYVPVLAAPSARANAPLENVRDAIRVNGGQCAAGWLIWEMPGVLVNAERYACWRSPDAQVIDVSPKPDGEKRILFLEGPEPWDGRRVSPTTVALSDEEPVKKYVQIYREERRHWANNVTHFQLQKELYLAMIALSDHLAARKKGPPRQK